MYNKDNFYKATKANFHGVPFQAAVEILKRKQDYISDSDSRYWYGENGVYRLSDHWGHVASCDWRLDNFWARLISPTESYMPCFGFCEWENFQANIPETKPITKEEKMAAALPKRELKILEEAQKRAKVRTATAEEIISAVLSSIERKSVSLNAMEGCTCIYSADIISRFPGAYRRKYSPECTYAKCRIHNGKIHLVEAWRAECNNNYCTWDLTKTAEKAILNAAKRN